MTPEPPPTPEHAAGGRAGHEHDRDYVDKDVAAPPPVEREGDYTDQNVDPEAPAVEREGEYTDSDVGPADTDPPVGGYTHRDVPGKER